MSNLDQEFYVSSEPWGSSPVHCHECGWNGTERDLDHIFEEGPAFSDEEDVQEAHSKYGGANCPQCQEKLVFQCLDCSWHGTIPAAGPEGFPNCSECGSKRVTLQVKETSWQLFRQSVSVEAQLGFDFAN